MYRYRTYLVTDRVCRLHIAPAGVKVLTASVQNVLAWKYMAPMSIEIVSVVVQIVPTGKNFPTG